MYETEDENYYGVKESMGQTLKVSLQIIDPNEKVWSNKLSLQFGTLGWGFVGRVIPE